MTRSSRGKTVAFFLLIHAASLSAGAVEVHLESKAYSRGSLILLGDLATIRDAEPESIARLQRIELFPAPRQGRARTVRRREISELLRLHAIDVARIRFTGAETVRIYAARRRQPPVAPTAQPVPATSQMPASSQMIVVAARPLNRGDVIREADVTLQPAVTPVRSTAALLGIQPLDQFSDVVGLELTRAVTADQPIDGRGLRKPVLVRRGDAVVVYSNAPGVRVRTTARATQDASHGDLVLLESPENRQRFTAQVTGYQQAEIYASGIVVSGTQAADSLRVNGMIRSSRKELSR